MIKSKKMEVHHDPDMHHKRKTFKEYFLEFLMIFLAVALGFFAESLREHIGDNSKEMEYINSVRKDLVTDSISTKLWIQGFNTRRVEYDSVVNMLRQPDTVAQS